MRSPSGRVLINRCDIFPVVAAQDEDGGLDADAAYPAASATDLPCSYQCETSIVMDETGRESTMNEWAILFATPSLDAIAPIKRNDRIDLKNPDGSPLASLYASGAFDYAGRSSTTEIPCREIL